MSRIGVKIRSIDKAFEASYKAKHLVARLKLIGFFYYTNHHLSMSRSKYVKHYGYRSWKRFVFIDPNDDLPF